MIKTRRSCMYKWNWGLGPGEQQFSCCDFF